jgi:hypothetical protein
LLWLNRTFLHHQGYGPFFSEFDPFRNVQHAQRDRGWIIDYLHCPLEVPVHPNKDCSQAQLRERIETVVAEGGDDVWLAPVEAPVDYRYVRRHARIRREGEPAGPHRGRGDLGMYVVSAPELPAQVRRRTATLRLSRGTRTVEVDGAPATVYRKRGVPLADVDLSQPRSLRLLG